MKRAILGLVLMVGVTACTPRQGAKYLEAWFSGHQAEATAAVTEYEATKADATAGRHCAEWYDLAIEAGFTPENWKEPLARIMWGESMCNPRADNSSSTADGLTQIVRGTWLSSCPDLEYSLRYDPATNLACAYRISGGGHYWGAWETY